MARLANQFAQVFASYATRPYTWGSIWVPLGCIVFTLRTQAPESQSLSFFLGFFAGGMFADVVRDQTRYQFAHSRSALLPGFALPHLLAAVAFAACATVLTPAILTMTLGTDFLNTTAMASAMFAVSSAQYRFIRNPFIQPLFPMLVAFAIFGLYTLGLSLWNLNIAKITFTPASSLTLLAASWTYIAASFVRLVRIREDEPAYQASERSNAGRRAACGRWYLQGLVSDSKSYTRKSVLSDRWNDRIRGYHHGHRQCIVRLLRHGYNARPPELVAILFVALVVLYSCGTIYGEKIGEFGDPNLPLATYRLVTVLFGLILPVAVAPPIGLSRPVIAAALLLPLTRKQLIDNSIIASTWNFAVYWIPFNALSVYMIWNVPGLDPNLLRITTFVFLSAATSVATFGFMLALQLEGFHFVLAIVAVISPFLPAALFLTWWFMRDAMSDLPFWIVATLLLSLGTWAARHARLASLNPELNSSI